MRYGASRNILHTTFDQHIPITSAKEFRGRLLVLGSLLLALVSYLCIGALCFSSLESKNEQRRWEYGKKQIDDYIEGVLPNSTESQKKDEAKSLTKIIRDLSGSGNPYIFEKREDAWSFTGGLYVSVSTVTTIGYGNIYPVTTGGQVFLVLYALFGIPLSFLFIAYLGALMASSVEYLFDSPLRDRKNGYSYTMFFVLLSSAGLVIVELLLFSVWIKYGLDRDMAYWDSFYFAFISFSTIGFGSEGFYNGDNANISKVLFTMLLVILCLAPLSLYINLLVRDLVSVATPILEKIGVGNGSSHGSDDERDMISKTKEFQGENYGAS